VTGWYERLILPRLIDATCGLEQIAEQRRRIVPEASGRVLELGFGSGLNLPFYNPSRVEELWGLEPSRAMLNMAEARAADALFPVTFLQAPAEAIPLHSASIDTAVTTYTLCTIPDPLKALREVARLLKPGGLLLFAEHGRAPDAGVLKWQGRLTPVWKRLAGGCHLGRDIPELLRKGGFEAVQLHCGYIAGPRLVSFNFLGAARHSLNSI
jgi:ubiquinone/menaquinone biosynthesis C-methylase UbiE